jgi:hypothetical protein
MSVEVRQNAAHNNDEFPLDSGQGSTVFYDHLITRADHRKSFCRLAPLVEVWEEFRLAKAFSLLGVAMVHEDWDGGSPFLEFRNPIGQGTEGRNDNMRAQVVLLFS